jgi:myo-inositol 2-dehydrogenase/D-chiro-inositol 1-dehydrogenase
MVGVAMLGAGRMAGVHSKAITQTRARIVSVFDVNQESALKLAGEVSAKPSGSAEEAVRAPGVDAVVIASASPSHVEYIRLAVRCGKRVMCEKPLAESYKGALELYRELGDGSKRVFLAFNRRYDPGHRKLWEKVRAGVIGEVKQLVLHSRDPALPPRAYIETSGGAFRDQMVHNFDLVRWIFDEEPISVFATGTCAFESWVGDVGDCDSTAAILTTRSGRIATITEARVSSFGFDQRIEAHGTKGMLLSDNPTQTPVKLYGAGGTDDMYCSTDRLKEFFLDRYGESYAREIEAFVDVILSDSEAPVNIHDGLRAAYISEAATRSFLKKMPVALNDESIFES